VGGEEDKDPRLLASSCVGRCVDRRARGQPCLRRYLLAAEDTTVTTGNDGNASFDCNKFPFPRELEGTVWSATATNEATGDTSEFSANFTVPVG
jgi:hypothetical protein